MKTMSLKLVIMMALCLHLSACGKAKNDGGVQPAPTAQKPVNSETDSTEAGRGGQDGSENEVADKSDGTTVSTTVTTKEKDQNVPSTVENPIHTKVKNVPGSGSVATSATSSTTKTTTTVKSKDSGSPFTQNQTQSEKSTVSTGGSDLERSVQKLRKEANKYSGASDDGLRATLQQKEETLSLRQQQENLKAAQSIQNVILKIDRTLLKKVTNGYRVIEERTGDVALSLTIGSGKTKRTVLMGGLMRPDRTSSLRNAKEALKADLKCMDLPLADIKTCETALITMQLGSGNVKMILRRTPMTVQTDFGTKQCMSQECENIYSMVIQTENGIQDVASIARASLESFEVIGGKSGFRGMIRTRGNSRGGEIEGITVGGELLNDQLNPVMNQVADRSMNIADIPDFRNLGINKNLHNSMSDVRIIGNDGRGNIRMKVNMSRQDNGSVDTFDLSFLRISREVLN